MVITPLATVLATPAVVAKLAVDAKLDELTVPTIFAAVKLVMLDPFPLKAVAFTVVTPKVVTPEIGPVKVSDPKVPTPVIAPKLPVTKLALVITPLATVLATPAVVAKLAVDAKLDELTVPTIFAAVKLVMPDPFPLKAVAFTVVTLKVVTPEIGPVKVSEPKVPTPVIALKLPVTKLALVITPLATVLATPAVVAKLAVDAKLDELTTPTIFAAVK